MNDLELFKITSMSQAMEMAKLIADSDLAPKDYKGKPGNVLIAIQLGHELGLQPMQAIQNIAVINGRPAVWGDSMIALVQSHPLCDYIKEKIENNVAYCTVKRKDEEEEYTFKFSLEDAKKAGLASKPGVWQQYPSRMLQMRARGFALRDKFADILKGVISREEAMDYVIEEKPLKVSQAKGILEKFVKVEPPVAISEFKEEKKTINTRVQQVFEKLNKMGIENSRIFNYYGIEHLTQVTPEILQSLIGVGTTIKEGHVKIDELFNQEELLDSSNMSASERINNLMHSKRDTTDVQNG